MRSEDIWTDSNEAGDHGSFNPVESLLLLVEAALPLHPVVTSILIGRTLLLLLRAYPHHVCLFPDL